MATWMQNEYKGYRDAETGAYVGQSWAGFYGVWTRNGEGRYVPQATGFATAGEAMAYAEALTQEVAA
jgi:hypothetical protein